MTGTPFPPLHIIDLGRQPYGPVLDLQRTLCRRRLRGDLVEDILLLVEHDPVVTLGRGTRATSLPVPAEHLRRAGFEVVEVERGGDVTAHEPGQLVGYPILDLQQHRPDLHWYLRTLEEGLIQALDALGIPAGRNPGLTGVWTSGRKIASLGIHVKQWITFHGFALNVVNDLRGFQYMVPCGIQGVMMTSIARELGAGREPRAVWQDARSAVVSAIGQVFDRAPVPAELGSLVGPDELSTLSPVEPASVA